MFACGFSLHFCYGKRIANWRNLSAAHVANVFCRNTSVCSYVLRHSSPLTATKFSEVLLETVQSHSSFFLLGIQLVYDPFKAPGIDSACIFHLAIIGPFVLFICHAWQAWHLDARFFLDNLIENWVRQNNFFRSHVSLGVGVVLSIVRLTNYHGLDWIPATVKNVVFTRSRSLPKVMENQPVVSLSSDASQTFGTGSKL